MKTTVAVTVGTADSIPEALVLFRDVCRSIPVVAELGYDGIEIALHDPKSVDTHQVNQLLSRHGVSVPVVSTGQISRVRSLHFVDSNPEIRRQAVDAFAEVIELADRFRADINVSLVRGNVSEGMGMDTAVEMLREALGTLCGKAAGYGLNLLLEQMNRYETNLLNSITDVGEFIRESGIANLKIHADTYHMNIEDADMCAILREFHTELGYIHFSDSNRLAPGEGHIDFAKILETLHDINYDRWIGIETLREPSGEAAARQAIAHIRASERRVSD